MDKKVSRLREWRKSQYYGTNVTIVLGILLLVVFFSLWGGLSRSTEVACERKLMRDISEIEKELNKKFEILELISNMEELANEKSDFKQKSRQVNERVRSDELLGIGIADLEGQAYLSGGKHADIKEAHYFNKALLGQWQITEATMSKHNGNRYTIYSKPILKDDKIFGVIYSIYDLKHTLEIIENTMNENQYNTILIDLEQKKISHDIVDLDSISQETEKIVTAQVINNSKDHLMMSGYQKNRDEPIFWLSQQIPKTSWVIVKMIPTKILFMKVNQVIAIVGLIFVVFIIFIYAKLKRTYEENHKKIIETENLDNIMVFRVSEEGLIIYANRLARINLGFSKDEILNKTINEIVVDSESHVMKSLMAFKKNGMKMRSMEIHFKTKEFKRLYAICTVKRIGDASDSYSIEISAIDISQYHFINSDQEKITNLYKLITASEEELQHQAKVLMEKQILLEESEKQLKQMLYFDELTQMPNKNWAKVRMKEYIDQKKKFIIVMMDVDNFKFINDSFGHDYGDGVLISIGQKLQSIVNQEIRVCRMGADEFIILIEEDMQRKKIQNLLETIQYLFIEPFTVNDMKLYISFSMGVALYPTDGESYNELMTNADTAMNRTKENGKKHYTFFDHQFKEDLIQKIKIENDLRRGIKEKEFILYYQPQTDIKTGKIRGFEALIRWIDKDGKIIPPVKFIDIAEESGLIVSIGEWVIEEACYFINRLGEGGYNDLYVAINVSVVQLMQSEFVETLKNIIQKTQVNPKLLHIEITETILMESIETNIQTIEQIKQQGPQVSLDDFGKGYSSLTYLKKLPIDVLKIEKTFIDDILVDQEKNITSAIINLGHDLDLEVVAEGVETESQKQYLTQYGCDMIQGYLVSRPIPEREILNLLKKHNETYKRLCQ